MTVAVIFFHGGKQMQPQGLWYALHREGRKRLVLPDFFGFFHGAGGTGAHFPLPGFLEEPDDVVHRPGHGGGYDDECEDLLQHIRRIKV